ERDFGLQFATGIMSAPSVWGTLPFDGQEGIPSNHPIQIVFDHPMDTDSVENALYIFPEVEYTTEWLENNFVLRIQFVEGFSPGTRYSIQVYRSAMSAYGISMEDTSKITFTGLE
ncbi:MAG: Ig-like domain-containing protein, partial [Dehalococcoidales bacterium]